ncbi:MAG: response regulator, partial [gamma proteobacterium symbiont of Bathyaustriella thionipta]|nr:response regulator [gamma proteobacterium symbiont of Bathyaustriella thionipta]
MSHEIRTPLNAILGFGQLAKASAENDKQKNYLNNIYNSAQSLLGIINDILDFSKIEANKLDIEETQFNLKEIAHQSLEQLIDKASENNIELLGMISSNIPATLIGDPLRLSQVFNNLLSNAIKFTEVGEVVLFIKLSYRDKDKIRLNFTIRDTGIGIEPSKIKTLFKAFEQADISTTREYGGTGLGLSICRQLISLMGGDIHVESQPGHGSTFSFTLPFNIPENDSLTAKKNTEALPHSKILIINNNKQACFIYKEYLRELSIHTDCLYSITEAIKQITHHSQLSSAYDAILLNDFLGNESAFDVIKQIRAIEHTENLKLILTTAPRKYRSTQEFVTKNHIQFDRILLKPVTTEKLLNSLQAVSNHNHQHSQAEHALWQPSATQLQRVLGAQVLLVEDIDINRELACEILSNWGIKVTTANNGREAVNCVEEFQYDVILMDIQMPELDGFEATKIIREQLKLTQLPIIAMTAQAMIGDKNKQLASGMNDYISKPIKIKNLFNTLLKWIAAKPLVNSGHPDITHHKIKNSPVPTEQDLPQLILINTTKGLINTAGNKKLYRNLLVKFKVRLDNEIPKLSRYLEENNIESFKQIVHNIKGVSGNLGASGLAKTAESLEAHPDKIELNQFMQECHNLSEELSILDNS